MLTRILAVAVALLLAFVVHLYNRVEALRADLAGSEVEAMTRARASLADTMEGQGAEIRRMMTWLDGFYRSPDGLQRPEGLWIDGHPDFEGIAVWVFDVYLRQRYRGDTEEQARQAVENAIKQSEEWRVKHRAQM
jgi:hypothetical protein